MRLIKFIVICFSLLFFAENTSFAQSTICGKVADGDGNPLALVSVKFLSLSDSTMLAGCITDSLGFYSLKLKNGEYHVAYSYFGFEPYSCDLAVNQDAGLKTVMLKTSAVMLDGVNVVAHRTSFRLEGNCMRIDVEHDSILNRQNNIYELLGRVPGVFRTGQTINIGGKGTPVYFINGRKVRDSKVVENLQMDQIVSIQVLFVPNAKYDSDGSPVVDIKTKKFGEGLAFNATGNFTQAKHSAQKYGINSSYSRNNLDLFLGYHYSDSKSKSNGGYEQQVLADTIWQMNHVDQELAHLHNHSLNLGIAYHLSDTAEVGVQYNGSYEYNKNMDVDSMAVIPSIGQDSFLFTDKSGRIRSNSHHFNAYYSACLKYNWHINLAADYVHKETKNNTRILETEVSANDLQYDSYSRWDVWATNVHAAHSFGKFGNLQFGYDFSHSVGVNNISYDRLNHNGNTATKEVKNAFFANYVIPIKEFSLNAGLRYEYISSKLEDREVDKTQRNCESKLLPSLGLSYSHGMLTQNLSYSVQTDRPRFDDLNDNEEYANKYLRNQGNSHLKTEVTHSLYYMLMYKFIYASVSYSYICNPFVSTVSTLPGKSSVLVSKQENLSKQQLIVAMLNLQKNFHAWTPNLSCVMQKSFLHYPGAAGKMLSDKQPVVMLNFNNDIQLAHGFLLSCGMQQIFGGYLKTLYIKPFTTFDFSLKKSFLNDRIRLSFDVYDLFNGSRSRSIWRYNNVFTKTNTKDESQKMGLTLTYRFRKNIDKKNNTSAESELKRLDMDSE